MELGNRRFQVSTVIGTGPFVKEPDNPEYKILVHPVYGEVPDFPLKPLPFTNQRLMNPSPAGRAYVERNYRDPGLPGDWIAVSAPVKETDFVVVVHQRLE